MNRKIYQTDEKGFTRHDRFETADERLAYTIMHEFGHGLFKNHPNADSYGHISGTIMDEMPFPNAPYDCDMIEKLEEMFGCQQ
jgi:hypothetical protein